MPAIPRWSDSPIGVIISGKMRVPAFTLTLAFLLSATGFGQKPSAAAGTISAAQILEKYIQATGGLQAHKRLETLIAQGDFGFYLPHPLGSYTFSYKAPSSDLLEMNRISHGISWSGRRENHLIRRTTVESTPTINGGGNFDGPGMIDGAGVEIFENAWRSLLDWDFSREYSKIELVGRSQVDKRWAFALRFTPRQGDPDVRFYDQESGLLVRMDQVQHYQLTREQREQVYAVETYFRDYTDRDGMKLPRMIAISRPEGELLFDITRFRPNAPIDDAVFQ